MVPVEQSTIVTSLPERSDDQDDLRANTLRDLRAQLDTTEAHIYGYNDALRNAQLVRIRLRQAINEQLKTRTPIHTCPPEVLARIFWFFAGLQPGLEKSFQILDTTTGPWRLGQVCRTWRTVVWDTPRLWSSFSLDWFGLYDMPEDMQREATDRFIEVFTRTKQAPLAVEINFEHEPWVHACFDLIACEAHRVEELALAGTPGQLIRQMTTTFQRLPALDSLELTIFAQGYSASEDRIELEGGPITFTFAPLLRRLDLICYPGTGFRPSRMPLPYAQLLQLEVKFPDFVSLSSTLSALAQCKNLVLFRDMNDYPMPNVSPAQPEISLNHLKSASIFSPTLLSFITAPALKLLMLSHDYHWFVDSEDPEGSLSPVCGVMKTFQERSQCRIGGAFFLPIPPGDACRNFLRGFADLNALAINAWEEDSEDKYTSSFISLLKRNPEETFLPQLDTLSVCLSAAPHLTCLFGLQPEVPRDTAIEVALAQVIASRRNAPPDQPILKAVNIVYICSGWRREIGLDDIFTAATATTFYKTLCDLGREGLILSFHFLPDQYYNWYVLEYIGLFDRKLI